MLLQVTANLSAKKTRVRRNWLLSEKGEAGEDSRGWQRSEWSACSHLRQDFSVRKKNITSLNVWENFFLILRNICYNLSSLLLEGFIFEVPAKTFTRREIVAITKSTWARFGSVAFACTHRRCLIRDCEINEWVRGLKESQKAPPAWNILLGSVDKLPPH